MGRKAKWFGAVKKVFSPESRKSRKTKDKWEIEKSKQSDTSTSESFEKSAETTAPPPPPAALSHPKVVVKPVEGKGICREAGEGAGEEDEEQRADGGDQAVHDAGEDVVGDNRHHLDEDLNDGNVVVFVAVMTDSR